MGEQDRPRNGESPHPAKPVHYGETGTLGDSEEWTTRYEAAVRAGRLVLYDWDLARGEIVWGGEVEKILGYRLDEMGDAAWAFEQIHPDDRLAAETEAARAFAMRTPGVTQYRVRRRDGSYIHVEDCTEYLSGNGSRSARLIGFVSDVSERQRAEEQLRRMTATLERRVAERTAEAERRAVKIRELASELTRTEQRERQRLARLLHDHLQQLLVAARLRVEALRNSVQDEPLQETVNELEGLLREAGDAARSLAVELCPPILHERGLLAALGWLADWMRQKHALTVTVVTDERAEPSDDSLRMLLFEIVRELLFNVVKHAGTDRAEVRCSLQGEQELVIVVSDGGTGLTAEQAEDRRSGSGSGLANVRQRLELVDGRLEIESVPGHGTRVRIRLPLREPRRAAAARTRVLLVDDHEGFRQQLAGALRTQPDFEVVGEAEEGTAAVEMARQTRPHIVVTEASLTGASIELARQILSELPQTHVVGVSDEDADELVEALFDAGISAFLTKQRPVEELVDAIRELRPLVL